MYVISVEAGNSKYEFNIAESLSEISLSQAIQFVNASNDYYKWQKSIVDDDSELDLVDYQLSEITHLYECVKAFLDTDFVKNFRIGDFMDEGEATIISIFNQISELFTNYVPKIDFEKDYYFTHKGAQFVLPRFLLSQLTSNVINPKLTVSEVTECLEVKRLCNSMRVAKSDDTNNIDFTEYLKILAILTRKVEDGEKLNEWPKSQTDINIFIEDRANFFSDINMLPAWDCNFFLLAISIM